MGNKAVRKNKVVVPLKLTGPIRMESIERLLKLGFLPILSCPTAQK